MKRRHVLRLISTVGAVAVTGCVGGDEDPDDGTSAGQDAKSTPTATPDQAGDDDPPADKDEEGGGREADEELHEHEYDHPGEAVEAFIVAWQECKVEAANALLYEDGELEHFEGTPEELVAEAPEIETIERPEVDGNAATVGTVLVPPDEDEPQRITFELTKVDGVWLIVDLTPEAKEVTPAVTFDTEFGDGAVTVTHAGGDAVSADELFVRGDGLAETGVWYELAGDVDAEDDVMAGMSITVEVDDEYTIGLVWDDGEHSAILHSHNGASETATDGPSAVDSHLENTDNYDGTIEEFTGEDEVVVTVGEYDDADQPFFFGPPAIRVDEGTTVVWEWTGDGGAHNVYHDVDEPAFESDLMDAEGETFNHTFEETGTYLYVCQPHEGLGMNGAVVVE